MKNQITQPYLDVEPMFNTALALLSIIQDHFADDRDKLNDDIIYFSLEGVRNEIVRAQTILIHGDLTQKTHAN